MDTQFPVRWRRIWRSMTIYMSVGILIPVAFAVGLRAWKLGAAEGFRHITPFGAGVGVIAIIGFSAVFALLLALFFRVMAVRITDEFIEGRNYWCMKKRIPLSAIESLSRFSSSGVDAIVVSSRHHGKIYISVHTEGLADLIELLGTYLPPQNA